MGWGSGNSLFVQWPLQNGTRHNHKAQKTRIRATVYRLTVITWNTGPEVDIVRAVADALNLWSLCIQVILAQNVPLYTECTHQTYTDTLWEACCLCFCNWGRGNEREAYICIYVHICIYICTYMYSITMTMNSQVYRMFKGTNSHYPMTVWVPPHFEKSTSLVTDAYTVNPQLSEPRLSGSSIIRITKSPCTWHMDYAIIAPTHIHSTKST